MISRRSFPSFNRSALPSQAADKNSGDIAQLIEVSRNTLEISHRNSEVVVRHSESIATMEDVMRSIQASNERMDRLIDYLIRRDQGQ